MPISQIIIDALAACVSVVFVRLGKLAFSKIKYAIRAMNSAEADRAKMDLLFSDLELRRPDIVRGYRARRMAGRWF